MSVRSQHYFAKSITKLAFEAEIKCIVSLHVNIRDIDNYHITISNEFSQLITMQWTCGSDASFRSDRPNGRKCISLNPWNEAMTKLLSCYQISSFVSHVFSECWFSYSRSLSFVSSKICSWGRRSFQKLITFLDLTECEKSFLKTFSAIHHYYYQYIHQALLVFRQENRKSRKNLR